MDAAAFDAFISYSHKNADIAAALQRALQRFARPWYRRRSFRIFRDTSNLAAEPSLWGAVAKALDASRSFILVASPEAALSPWVDREVRHWLSSHPPESIILVRVSGVVAWNTSSGDFDWNTTNALPPALRGVYRSEPLYVELDSSVRDLRRTPAAQHAVGQIAATLRGVSLDEILGEDLRAHRRTRMTVAATVLTLVALIIAGTAAYVRSLRERAEKEQRGRVALSRRLAAQSRASLASRNAREAAMLGLASLRTSETQEAWEALLEALRTTRLLVADFEASKHPINALGFTPGAEGLMVGDAQGEIIFWDLSTASPRKRIPRVHPEGVADLAVAPDRKLAASVGNESGLVLWDMSRLEARPAVAGLRGFSLVFTPDGSSLLLGGDGGLLTEWDVRREKVSGSRSHPEDVTLLDLALDTSGEHLVTGSFGTVRLWGLRPLRALQAIDAEPTSGAFVDISPDGSRVLFAGGDALAQWDVQGQAPYGDPIIRTSTGVGDALFVGAGHELWVSFGPDLFSSSVELRQVGFQRADIRTLAVERKRGLVATGGQDGRIRLWARSPRNAFLKTFSLPDENLGAISVALSPDGSRLAVGASDTRFQFLPTPAFSSSRGVIYLFDVATGELVGPPLEGHQGQIGHLAFSGSNQLASASDDGTARLWDLSRARSVLVAKGAAGHPALQAVFSTDGQTLAVAFQDEPVQFWEVEHGTQLASSRLPDVLSVDAAPAGDFILGTSRGALHLWSHSKRSERQLLSLGGSEPVSWISSDPRGRWLVTLVGEQLKLVDLEQHTVEPLLQAPATQGLSGLSVSQGWALWRRKSGQISLWDLSSRQKLADLAPGSEASIDPMPRRVAMARDTRRAAAIIDNAPAVFDLDPATLKKRACEVAGAPLSQEEWRLLAGEAPYEPLCP